MSSRRSHTPTTSPVAAEIRKFHEHAQLHPGENDLAPCTGEQYAFEGEAGEGGTWIKPPYRVYRHGLVVTSQIEGEPVETKVAEDEDQARAEFADGTCDCDGPGAIQPGDTIKYGPSDEIMVVVAVTRHDQESSVAGAFTVFDGTRAIKLSYWEYRIIRRPAPALTGAEILADLRAEFAAWHADGASSNDSEQFLDDFLTERGLPTVLYGKPEPVAEDPDFKVHSCWPGHGTEPKPFGAGKKLPRGTCLRCDELNDGAPRREAPPAIQAGIDKRRLAEQRSRDIEAHYAPGGGHEKCMAKSIVPTCFDW